MLSPAIAMHFFDQGLNGLWGRETRDAMAQIEYMPALSDATKVIDHFTRLAAYGVMATKQYHRVDIPLQGHCIAHALAYLGQAGRPVKAY